MYHCLRSTKLNAFPVQSTETGSSSLLNVCDYCNGFKKLHILGIHFFGVIRIQIRCNDKIEKHIFALCTHNYVLRCLSICLADASLLQYKTGSIIVVKQLQAFYQVYSGKVPFAVESLMIIMMTIITSKENVNEPCLDRQLSVEQKLFEMKVCVGLR